MAVMGCMHDLYTKAPMKVEVEREVDVKLIPCEDSFPFAIALAAMQKDGGIFHIDRENCECEGCAEYISKKHSKEAEKLDKQPCRCETYHTCYLFTQKAELSDETDRDEDKANTNV